MGVLSKSKSEAGGRRQASVEDGDRMEDLKKEHTTESSALSTYAPVRSWPMQKEQDKGTKQLKDNPPTGTPKMDKLLIAQLLAEWGVCLPWG